MRFSFSEKREHYKNVAKGNKPVKKDSKFSKERQIGYAQGRTDAYNESSAIYKYKNSTAEERANYAAERARNRELRKSKISKLEAK